MRCCDRIPAAIFSEELLQAYPNTKVILTKPDPDKWVRSMDQTILHAIVVAQLGISLTI
jgi:Sulfotransferase domain